MVNPSAPLDASQVRDWRDGQPWLDSVAAVLHSALLESRAELHYARPYLFAAMAVTSP